MVWCSECSALMDAPRDAYLDPRPGEKIYTVECPNGHQVTIVRRLTTTESAGR